MKVTFSARECVTLTEINISNSFYFRPSHRVQYLVAELRLHRSVTAVFFSLLQISTSV